jgi:hypothetical protein
MSFTFHTSACHSLIDNCIAKRGHVTQKFCSLVILSFTNFNFHWQIYNSVHFNTIHFSYSQIKILVFYTNNLIFFSLHYKNQITAVKTIHLDLHWNSHKLGSDMMGDDCGLKSKLQRILCQLSVCLKTISDYTHKIHTMQDWFLKEWTSGSAILLNVTNLQAKVSLSFLICMLQNLGSMYSGPQC